MLAELKYYVIVALHCVKMSMQRTLEYPAELVGWLFANPVQFILGIATIKFVISDFGTINGWGFNEIAFLYGLAVMSHALSVMFFVQTWWMGYFILKGDFDCYMLRPLNVLFQFFFSAFNLIGVTDMISGIIIFAYGCSKVHFSFNVVNVVLLLFILIGATLIRGTLYLITGCLSFLTKSRNSLVLFNLTILDQMTKYPLTMYPRVVQIIFTFLIPLGFISFYPASDLLDKNNSFCFPGGIAWATFLVGVLVFYLATRLFKRGLRRYESAGS